MIYFEGAFGPFFLYVKNFFLQISHICSRTECSYYEERRIRGESPGYLLKQLHDRKTQKSLVLLRGHQLKITFPIPDTVSWQAKDGRNCGEIVAVLLCIRTALLFGLSAYPREWRPQSCTEIGVARPCCFHDSCRGSRGHMFQNHNLARLKAGLRSTLWWNM